MEVFAVMSAHRLQKLNHVFVISGNTWHERGILGKKGEKRRGTLHPGSGRKRRKD